MFIKKVITAVVMYRLTVHDVKHEAACYTTLHLALIHCPPVETDAHLVSLH